MSKSEYGKPEKHVVPEPAASVSNLPGFGPSDLFSTGGGPAFGTADFDIRISDFAAGEPSC